MLFKKGFLCALLFLATTINAFGSSGAGALERQLKNAEFEFNVGVAILSSDRYRVTQPKLYFDCGASKLARTEG